MKLAGELGLGKKDDWEAAFLQQTATKDDSRQKARLARERWRRLSWRIRHRAHSQNREDRQSSLGTDGGAD